VALNQKSSTLPAMVGQYAAVHGKEIVFRKKDRGIWKSVSWAEFGDRVRLAAMALKADGFRSGDVAGILADTRPEWVQLDLGILAASGANIGIPPQQNASETTTVLHEAGVSVLFVENEEQLDKALLARATCPTLRRIVIIEMKGLRDFTDPMCESLEVFLDRGLQHDRANPGDWDSGVAGIDPSQQAVILNETGTSLKAMTHREVLGVLTAAATTLDPHPGDERLAVLPMSSFTERVLGFYLSLQCRVISNYQENPDTTVENLQELQPAILGADASIWQLLYQRVTRAADNATRLQRALYRWGLRAGCSAGAAAWLARLLVLRFVRRDSGLARLRLAYVDGAPLSTEAECWAGALGISIRRMDGLHTVAEDQDARAPAQMRAVFSGT
jgi:long-chain acyl-CoA synthetase